MIDSLAEAWQLPTQLVAARWVLSGNITRPRGVQLLRRNMPVASYPACATQVAAACRYRVICMVRLGLYLQTKSMDTWASRAWY